MPTTPFALAQISVNAGAPASGGLTVAGASTIQLSGTNTANWGQARWEIYAYPENWPTPSGWTLDSNTGIIYFLGTTPTLITLEAAATRWGKWLVRLIVNGGTKNGVSPVFDPTTGSYLANDVIDFASGWEVVSPVFGFSEPGLFESTQFGGLRRWVRALQRMLHALETALGSTAAGAAWQTGTDTNFQIANGSGQQIVIIPTLTAARMWKMPTAPLDGQPFGLYDARGVLVDTGNTLSVTTNGGADHFWVGGVDKGTTWQVPASLFKGGTANLVRRAATSTWELAL